MSSISNTTSSLIDSFSAADVACTFDLILTPDRLRRNPRSAWYTNLEKVTADNPSQVTFHLKQPQPSLLALLALVTLALKSFIEWRVHRQAIHANGDE